MIMLIGNKCDLERREVSFEEGAWFARQLLVLQPGRFAHGSDHTGESLLRVVSLLYAEFCCLKDWSIRDFTDIGRSSKVVKLMGFRLGSHFSVISGMVCSSWRRQLRQVSCWADSSDS